MTIYTDVQAAEELLRQAYNLETGEVLDEQQLTDAEALKAEIMEQGLERLCKVRQNRIAEIEAMAAEEARIAERRKDAEKRLENLEGYIYKVYQLGTDPVQYAGAFTVSSRKSTKVIVDDIFADDRFMVEKTTSTVDKKALKDALQAGEQIAGAHLQTNYNLQIK